MFEHLTKGVLDFQINPARDYLLIAFQLLITACNLQSWLVICYV